MDKVQEIRKALEWSTPRPYNVLWYNAEFGQGVTEAALHGWLSYLLSELEERDRELELFDQRGERIEQLLDEKESLQQQLDAANQTISTLRENMMEQMTRFGEEMLAVKQENEQLRYDMTCLHLGHKKEIDYRGNAFQALQQRLKHAIKALEFYAAEETYDIEHLDRYGYIIIDKERGNKARAALSLLREETDPPYMAHGSLGLLVKRPDTTPAALGGSVETKRKG